MENSHSVIPPLNQIVLDNRRRVAHLRTAALLSLASGSLIIFSGFTSRALILSTLVRGTQGLIMQSAALLFGAFLILSGMFFVVGGLMLIFKNYSFGRPLVALAGGLSIFTLALCLVLAYISSSFSASSLLLVHPEYIAGIFLACGSTAIELQTEPIW